MICAFCTTERTYEFLKTVPRAGGKGWVRHVYVDEGGRTWSGRKCPTCITGERISDPDFKGVYKHSNRKCRKCNKVMLHNYFYHETCQPLLDYWDLNADYSSHL